MITFPDDLDPDEYVQQYGREGFDRLKANAMTLNEFKLESMAQKYDLNDVNAREQYAKAACAFVAGLQPIEQDRYYRQIAKKTGYPLEALQAQGVRSGGIAPETEKPAIRGGFRRRLDAEEEPRDVTERALILACLADRAALSLAMEAHAEELIRNAAYNALYRALCEQRDAFSLAKYIGELSESDAEIASSILKEEDALENARQAAADCIKRLIKEQKADEIAQLQAELKRTDLTAEEREAVLKEITKRIRANK